MRTLLFASRLLGLALVVLQLIPAARAQAPLDVADLDLAGAAEQATTADKDVAVWLYTDGFIADPAPEANIPDDARIREQLQEAFVLISVEAGSEDGEALIKRHAGLADAAYFGALVLLSPENELYAYVAPQETDDAVGAYRAALHAYGRAKATE